MGQEVVQESEDRLYPNETFPMRNRRRDRLMSVRYAWDVPFDSPAQRDPRRGSALLVMPANTEMQWNPAVGTLHLRTPFETHTFYHVTEIEVLHVDSTVLPRRP